MCGSEDFDESLSHEMVIYIGHVIQNKLKQ